MIRTSHGRGFRFVGSLVQQAAGEIDPPATDSDLTGAVSASGFSGTSLVILPFEVFNAEAELSYLADGLVEDLTTLLARNTGLLVISRSSSFAYKGQRPSSQQVRQELQVDCMVEGSVRRLADRLRISVQLIDTRDGRHLWVRRFDHSGDDLEALQDELLESICRYLEPQLQRVSYAQLRQLDCDHNAWALYQQAYGLLALKGWQPETFTEAIELLQRCVQIDPQFATAHAYLALIIALGLQVGLLQERDSALLQSLQAAETALRLDDHDSVVLGFAGCALADIGQQQRALPILELAVELDPSNAQAWAALGAVKLTLHQLEAGLQDLQHGIRISPLDNRLAIWGSMLALGLMKSAELEAAIDAARMACQSDLRNHIPRLALAAVLHAAGQVDAACDALAEAFRLRPELSKNEIKSLLGSRGLSAIQQLQH